MDKYSNIKIELDEVLELLPEEVNIWAECSHRINDGTPIDMLQECIDHLSIDVLYDDEELWDDYNIALDNLCDGLMWEIATDLAEEYDVSSSDRLMIEDHIYDTIKDDFESVLKDELEERNIYGADYAKSYILYSSVDGVAATTIEVPLDNLSMENNYKDSRLKELIDIFNLNPSTMASVLKSIGEEVDGDFPNLSERNGHELVEYNDLAKEWHNKAAEWDMLIVLSPIKIEELLAWVSPITEVTTEAGHRCGLYSTKDNLLNSFSLTLKDDLSLTDKNGISLKVHSSYNYVYGRDVEEAYTKANGELFHKTSSLNYSKQCIEMDQTKESDTKKTISLNKRGGGIKM